MNAFTLSHALVDTYAALRPTAATFMGVPGHDHRWDDFSPAGAAEFRALLARVRADVAALPPPPDHWHTLAADVLTDWCDLEDERYAHNDHLHDLNSIASTFQVLRMVFDVMDTTTAAGWGAICARLETLDAAAASYQALLAEGLAKGEIVAIRQIEAVVRQGRMAAGDGGFYSGMAKTLAEAENGTLATPALTARLDAALARARSAIGGLCDWLETQYAPHAPHKDGVGRARYIRSARRFLGMTIDPEETYAWGWREIAAIEAEMAALAEQIAPGKTVAEVLEQLAKDPTRQAPNAAAFLETIQAREQQALNDLAGKHFDVPEPVRRLDVRRAPDTGTRGAYYMQPSEDFSRPGTVWYAISDDPVPLWDEISTAYHEGFPGHHLQIGIQVSLTQQLSRWHRLYEGYSGYAEGWALYAEQLMRELGYYERPDYIFGMLANQLMRALRVVIDIGAHLDLPIPDDAPFGVGQRWSYALAVEALNTRGGMKLDHAQSDVTRYFGWPGQAISYKVGQRVMLSLRDAWRAKHGDDAASLRAFHTKVLGCGTVGLDRLLVLVLG